MLISLNISTTKADEIEALQAIYPDEFEMIEEPSKYRIKLLPNPADGDENNHVGIYLVCEIPSDYPEIVPTISIEVIKGLGASHEEEIMAVGAQKLEENLGMPSIFATAEAIREWLVENNVEGQDGSMYAEMMRKQSQKDVDEKRKEKKAAIARAADKENEVVEVDPVELEIIRKRQAGTPVTLEVFMKWRENFEAEKRAGEVEKVVMEKKPTGKELFLTNKAGMEEAILAAAAAEGSRGGGGVDVEVDQELFADDLENLDLEDFSSDDDDYVPGNSDDSDGDD